MKFAPVQRSGKGALSDGDVRLFVGLSVCLSLVEHESCTKTNKPINVKM